MEDVDPGDDENDEQPEGSADDLPLRVILDFAVVLPECNACKQADEVNDVVQTHGCDESATHMNLL